MKKHRLKLALALILVLTSVSFLTLVGCDNDPSDGNPDLKGTDYKVSTGDYTFYANKEKYTDLETLRGDESLCQIEIEVVKVKREGNVLTIDVSKPKNCDVEFEVLWNGTILESFPMQCHLYIHPTSKSCTDQGEKEVEVLTLYLEEVLKDLDASYIEGTNFTIKESCRLVDIVCAKNCDVTITTSSK